MNKYSDELIDFLKVLENSTFCNSTNLSLAFLGKDKTDNDVFLDLKKETHVLIAGATGSGKSCMLNSIISSLMLKNTKETARFLLIDPKRVEFFNYKDSDMLYGGEVIQDIKEAIFALECVCHEMDRRYQRLEFDKKRSYEEYNNPSVMKQLFICIDELSYLMLESRKEAESYISKIGMLGRACGIHLILATQQPSRKVITGTIQANIPCVIGLATRNKIDSRMITQNNICTELKGKGDAVLLSGVEETRFQGAYINQFEIEDIVNNVISIEKNEESTNHKEITDLKVSFVGKAYENDDALKYRA